MAEACVSRTHRPQENLTTAGFEDREDHRTPCASEGKALSASLTNAKGIHPSGLGFVSQNVQGTNNTAGAGIRHGRGFPHPWSTEPAMAAGLRRGILPLGGSITVHDYPAPRVIPRRSSSNSEHGEQTGGKPWQSFPSSESFSTLAIAHPCPGCTEPFIADIANSIWS